jgi:hypothetical protein
MKKSIEAVADNIWLFDGPEVPFLGLHIPTRMTIIRIGEDLWVHSPVPITDSIARFMTPLGRICYVIAPNSLHHLFLLDWQTAYPDARYFSAPGLRAKRQDLRFDEDLTPDGSYGWSDSIPHNHFAGNRFFEEVIFFHQSSRTLILTDLILNLRGERFNLAQKVFAAFDGILYPKGSSPRLFRWSMKNLTSARESYRQIIEWDPVNIVISHGECIRGNGKREAEKRLGWVNGR